MNTKNENEKPTEKGETRPRRPGPEPFDPEPSTAAAKEAESRETAEGGYGWGV